VKNAGGNYIPFTGVKKQTKEKEMLKFCYGRAIVPTTKIEYIPVDFVDDPKDLQAAVSVLARYRRNQQGLNMLRMLWRIFHS
jgi:hypothetical protein